MSVLRGRIDSDPCLRLSLSEEPWSIYRVQQSSEQQGNRPVSVSHRRGGHRVTEKKTRPGPKTPSSTIYRIHHPHSPRHFSVFTSQGNMVGLGPKPPPSRKGTGTCTRPSPAPPSRLWCPVARGVANGAVVAAARGVLALGTPATGVFPAFCPTPLLFPEQTTTQAHISSCCFRLLRVLVPHRSRVSPEQAGQKEKSDLLFTAELCCFDENLVVEPNSARCDITSQLLAVSSDLLPHPSSLGSVPPAVDRLLYFVSPLPRCWFQNHNSTIPPPRSCRNGHAAWKAEEPALPQPQPQTSSATPACLPSAPPTHQQPVHPRGQGTVCSEPRLRLIMAVGSLADAPKDLLNEIKQLEKLFSIDTAKLKEITERFVNELTKGTCTPTAPANGQTAIDRV